MHSSTSNSDTARGASQPVGANDQESDYWRRPAPERPWLIVTLCAALVTAALVGGWEAHWRTQWQVAGDFKNSNGLWAQERRRAIGDATVIIGTSRAAYGLDLDVWESAGRGRPVQLALPGTSPRLFLSDLAADERFHGLLIVELTVSGFFTQRGGRNERVLPYYSDETLSQRADHELSMHLERTFAFIDEQTRPKRMLFLAPLPPRPGQAERMDPHKLAVYGADRNAELWTRVLEDAAYRQEFMRVWTRTVSRYRRLSNAHVSEVVAETRRDVERIRARGGEVVFVRLPYEGAYRREDEFFPRARFWDRLIRETDSIGVAWQDYPELQGYELPEWSHLSPREGERYTRALTGILYARLDGEAPP